MEEDNAATTEPAEASAGLEDNEEVRRHSGRAVAPAPAGLLSRSLA